MTDKTARDLVMGTLYCVIGGICWGISGTTAEYLMAHKGLSADWISVLRMLVGGGAILLYAFSRQGWGIFALWRDPVSVVRVAAFGFLGMNLAQYAYVLAIDASNAGTATMLQYTGPIGVLLVNCTLARRLPSGRESMAILLAVTGTFLIATHGSFSSLSLSPAALFWGFLAAAGLIVNFIASEPLIHRWGNATATGTALVLAGAGSLGRGHRAGLSGSGSGGHHRGLYYFYAGLCHDRLSSGLYAGIDGAPVGSDLLSGISGHRLHRHGPGRLYLHHGNGLSFGQIKRPPSIVD